MSTAEAIFEKAKALPDNRQIEALNFVNFLVSQELAHKESSEWASFSADQLSHQYGEEDAIYDRD
jgi:hypothetical protein